jgi:integrase
MTLRQCRMTLWPHRDFLLNLVFVSPDYAIHRIRWDMHQRRKRNMAKKKNPRGLFERPPGSGCWWINYYVDGKQHREKVGTITNAKKLYGKRKEDARVGRKLPELRNSKFVSLSELIDDVLEYVADHKDKRNYISKAKIVRTVLGSTPAVALKPQELSRWLKDNTKTPGTHNRYKAFISLCYRVGNTNEKVDVNPAKKVRPRPEEEGRQRYYSHDEYNRLLEVIQRRSPEHVAEFIVSVHTGMRLGEQYTITWSQVHLDRREIRLYKTKNGSSRTVSLNADAVAALRSAQRPGRRPKDRVFPREGANFDTRSWLRPSLEEAKIEDAVHHTARHTFCSWLALKGASAHEIMAAAGHKTLSVSARYTHLNPKHTQSVVERISTIQSSNVEHAPEHAPKVFRDRIKRTVK